MNEDLRLFLWAHYFALILHALIEEPLENPLIASREMILSLPDAS